MMTSADELSLNQMVQRATFLEKMLAAEDKPLFERMNLLAELNILDRRIAAALRPHKEPSP